MDFSPRVNFQCRLSYSVHTPAGTITYINNCGHIKDPVVHVREFDRLYGNTKTLGMHYSLGSTTIAAGFLGEGNPDFLWEKFQWDNTLVKMFLKNVLSNTSSINVHAYCN